MNIKNLALGFMGFIVRASILAIAILVIFKTGQKAYDFGFRIFTEEAMSPPPGREVAVTIVQGDARGKGSYKGLQTVLGTEEMLGI